MINSGKQAIYKLLVAGLEITVTRKRIKNLHLRIIPPDGDVTISAPYLMSQRSIERFVISKLDWINRNRSRIISLTPSVSPEYVTGEKHLLFGEEFELEVFEGCSKKDVSREDGRIIMRLNGHMDTMKRELMLEKWYARQLEPVLIHYIKRFEPVMGVKVNEIKIRKMKTRWGTCNPAVARLRFNLELARKPLHIVEYIVLHEMVHLLEKGHNERFYGFMDRWMPGWKNYRKELRSRSL
jgi:predicted metal-dependent hydrolase